MMPINNNDNDNNSSAVKDIRHYLDDIAKRGVRESYDQSHHASGVLPACIVGDAMEGQREEEQHPRHSQSQEETNRLMDVGEEVESQEEV